MAFKVKSLLNSFFGILIVSYLVTRAWTLGVFLYFGAESEIVKQITRDPWHHYHFAIGLIVLALIFRKKRHAASVLPIGLGIFLEEWPIFLYDLGFQTSKLYLTRVDFVTTLFFIALAIGLSKILQKSN